MRERVRLLRNRRRNTRISVTDADHSDAGQAVQISFSVAIGQVRALAADKRHGQTGIGIH